MANLTETSRWEAGIYQLETSDPVMGGPNGIDNRPTRELANRTLWLKNEIAKAVQSIGSNKTAADQAIALKANAATLFTAGAGLTGGGSLAANRSFALATPSTLNGSTTNWAGNGATGHTHELAKATPTVAGVAKLVNTLDVSATDAALTAAMGKKLQDEKLGNSGNQTITNGTLTVGKSNEWAAVRIPSGAGVWEIETNPQSAAATEGSIRMGFKFVESGQSAKGIIMPALSTGYETVAYQSWVNEKIAHLDNGKVPSVAYNYSIRNSTDYSKSGFYRANGNELDGKRLPWMEMHISHPEQSENQYGRGIGFSYGPSFDLVTTAWDAQGVYQGMKKILTEENGVMKNGDTMTGFLTFAKQPWPKIQLASNKGGQALLVESGGTAGTHCFIIRNHEDGEVRNGNIVRFNLPDKTGTHTLATTGDLEALSRVDLTGNQTVGGQKTFAARTHFSDGLTISAANTGQSAEFRRGAADWYWGNPISRKALQLKDNGDLAYQNQKIYHEGNKPAWNDIQNKPDVATRGTTLAHYGITDSVTAVDFQWANVKTGTIMYFAGGQAPHGWLAANGAAVNRTTFPHLFAIIGTRYGAGDGSTTFNLPDLRGEFVRGWDAGRNVDAGRALGSWQQDEFRSHHHIYRRGHLTNSVPWEHREASRDGSAATYDGDGRFDDGGDRVTTSASGGVETRPRNIALLAIIKA
ncbi:phage tail protein [Neisseria chenwenguii]|uniref:phage tail protein n=1 Tax=Neisseria chenwenguii TaxID=1853278 RepID=UPI0018F2F7F8|nr:phage tail protein [Neisseria chenwenguii]